MFYFGVDLGWGGEQQAPLFEEARLPVTSPEPVPTLTCSLDEASSDVYLVFADCELSGGMTLTGAVQNVYDKYHADEVTQNFSAAFRAHPKMLKELRSCDRRHWPPGDPTCVGYALGMAQSLVQLRPEVLYSRRRGGARTKR